MATEKDAVRIIEEHLSKWDIHISRRRDNKWITNNRMDPCGMKEKGKTQKTLETLSGRSQAKKDDLNTEIGVIKRMTKFVERRKIPSSVIVYLHVSDSIHSCCFLE